MHLFQVLAHVIATTAILSAFGFGVVIVAARVIENRN
jgi:hypothetical protein